MKRRNQMKVLLISAGTFLFIFTAMAVSSAGPVPERPLALPAQELQHAVSVINIEVPVRVFKGKAFVDDLGLEDFEVYEDGKLQRVEAVYRIKKTEVEKKEEAGRVYTPDVSRRFVLVFELHEYLPKVGEALDEFFDQVIAPGDHLHIVTPVKTYNFKGEAFMRLSKRRIADQLRGILKNDLTLGNSEHRSLMKSLTDIFAMDVEFDIKQSMYMETARMLRDLKYMDERKIQEFADFLKDTEGQKHVFLFYQKELIPLLPGLDAFARAELSKDIAFDTVKVRQAFSDSSISVHFLFVTNKPGMHDNLDVGRMAPLRVEIMDQSDSIFAAFREVARATGGIADSSANPMASFRKAVSASENYYLVYYSPRDYRPDGKFRQIEVRVKGRNYRVTYRAGYYAN